MGQPATIAGFKRVDIVTLGTRTSGSGQWTAIVSTMASTPHTPIASPMSALEIRASASLASIFALRMLGLFLILPVFAVHAETLPGGNSATMVGLALGIYGLTQSFGQIPLGAASDRYGRKRIIVIGLLLFAIGSLICALADDIYWVIFGRAVQGAGAISAAVTAFIADATREEHRTKAMAMVGGSIGLTFAGSLVGAPLLYDWIGMAGMFYLIAILSIAAIFVVVYITPEAPPLPKKPVSFTVVLRDPELMRLNYGVFALHVTQMAMFVVVPAAVISQVGLPVQEHWKVYLPVVLLSFALMLPPIFIGEKRGLMKQVFVAAIALLLLVQLGMGALFMQVGAPAWMLVTLLLLFFIAFNVLEATQPSLVSRIAPTAGRGAALGVYNTLQALGLFCGGALGGWLVQHTGPSSVFILGAVLTLAWLIIAANMKHLPRRSQHLAPAA